MKLVINDTYGGFSLSAKAKLRLWELGCKEIAMPVTEYWKNECNVDYKPDSLFGKKNALERWHSFLRGEEKESLFLTVFSKDEQFVLEMDRELPRNNSLLIQVVEELGIEANGRCASLKIIEIPDDVDWQIEEYDGNEWVAEKHRTWS